ncbi:hypothetical protein VNO78_17218 [Psophocarpus tetragonolobus]|uniref:Uncharacterized protein n=1 Tax=Psophocarpus tetragonolobus TaxID=3891 RepID=A0AAN9SMJ0_PSOTE
MIIIFQHLCKSFLLLCYLIFMKFSPFTSLGRFNITVTCEVITQKAHHLILSLDGMAMTHNQRSNLFAHAGKVTPKSGFCIALSDDEKGSSHPPVQLNLLPSTPILPIPWLSDACNNTLFLCSYA